MKRIEGKLLKAIVATVAIGFFVVAIGASMHFWKVLKAQTIYDEQQKLSLASSQIQYIQESAINVAKQVAIDNEIQSKILYQDDLSTFWAIVAKDEVRKHLAEYANLFSYIESISIYTKEGELFSSNLNLNDTDIESENWYQSFKAHDVRSGFTLPHSEHLGSQTVKHNVFSYVLTYQEVKNDGGMIGDIIVDINLECVEQELHMDSTLLSGWGLYDAWNKAVTTYGNDLPDEWWDILGDANKHFETNGNVLLRSEKLEGGWTLVSEVSYDKMVKELIWIYIFMICMFVILLVILTIILRLLIRNITGPIQELQELAHEVGQGNFEVSAQIHTNDELEILCDAFNGMIRDVREFMQENIEYEKRTKDLEINQLMLQINPHFIYNTLNSIVYMAQMNGNADIIKFANAFISLLQDTLRIGSNHVYVSIEQELKNLRNYLILQEYRYPNRFATKIECPNELLGCSIPNVFIQPIVENAIFHGLMGKQEKGSLEIIVEEEQGLIRIHVVDDGIGMDEDCVRRLLENDEPLAGRMRKIGVANVQQRIKHIYGENYGITISSNMGIGTKVTMSIPKYVQMKDGDM